MYVHLILFVSHALCCLLSTNDGTCSPSGESTNCAPPENSTRWRRDGTCLPRPQPAPVRHHLDLFRGTGGSSVPLLRRRREHGNDEQLQADEPCPVREVHGGIGGRLEAGKRCTSCPTTGHSPCFRWYRVRSRQIRAPGSFCDQQSITLFGPRLAFSGKGRMSFWRTHQKWQV